ncbi:methyl-accepting chemotaxis protein [Ponticoccus alexandrii]|uniref:Methyl-accepting chemotaxis protein n=1 Tax=Ponticoccus alexandrii TaxID=1943633 RepID=A0ABX7FEU3_9RHOB|nr:methyl-accepting chemotaxis protein [Ponticoccus alexandrii]
MLLCVCLGLAAMFHLEAGAAAQETAQQRQNQSVRILIDRFVQAFPGIGVKTDTAGNVVEVRWDALPEIAGHTLIDSVGRISGETATLFGWVPEEGDFIRLTTNIVKPDGTRAVGTWLGRENPVHATMMAGQTFRGEAVILGRPYYTLYQPIMGADGRPVGIFYVGVDRTVIDAQVSDLMRKTILATLTAIVLGVGLVLALLSVTLRPMTRISHRLQAMSAGDLESPVPETERPDALGQTARVVDGFRGQLIEAKRGEAQTALRRQEQERVVAALRRGLARLAERDLSVRIEGAPFPTEYQGLRDDFDDGVESLARALDEADTVAFTVRTSASEINATTDEIARRVEGQAATLVESAEALNQLAGSSKEIAANVDDADKLAGTSRTLANESGDVVRSAIEAINRVEVTSEKIGQIITAIDDIAFQTNLLALNAGVEAARAGSAGKGFAVVASEVRSLAQTAALSAQEIKTLITSSGEEVRQGSELVQRTGSSLTVVQEQIEKLGILMSGVAAAVRQQTTSMGEINDSVQNLEGTTQQNAAIVEEMSAAGQGLNIEAERLAQTLGQFRTGSARPEQAVPVDWDRAEEMAAPSIEPVEAVQDAPQAEKVAVPVGGADGQAPAPVSHSDGTWAEF